MAGFIFGDALGSIKAIRFTPEKGTDEPKVDIMTLLDGTALGKGKAVQAISPASATGLETRDLLAVARADGSVAVYSAQSHADDITLRAMHEWKEARFKADSTFVGFASLDEGLYSCTSNGALRFTSLLPASTGETRGLASKLATLPMRLCDWRLSPSGQSFAYGGDEVELSVWDAERAFASPTVPSPPASSSKRKRGDMLLPAETWRAKNVPNDSLSLRVPVHNTSLAFLADNTSPSSGHHLLTGTQIGNVRRYDTRAARKPVADWTGIVKAGGVKRVENGVQEHEAFVSDNRSNLSAIDLRNGKILYSYKGISAAITSHTSPIPHQPFLLASASNDRYLRLHSTVEPPTSPGARQERKGEVLAKAYIGAVPTAVIWDGQEVVWDAEEEAQSADDGDEEVWDGMEDVGEDDSEDEEAPKRAGKKSKK